MKIKHLRYRFLVFLTDRVCEILRFKICISIGYSFCPERNFISFSIGLSPPVHGDPRERELVGLNRVGIWVRLLFLIKWFVYRFNKHQSCIFAWWKLRHSSIFRKKRDIRRPGEALTGRRTEGSKYGTSREIRAVGNPSSLQEIIYSKICNKPWLLTATVCYCYCYCYCC